MSEKKRIKLRIRDTDKIVFDGWVDRISSFNEVGPFDVYPKHANFISMIRKVLTLFNDGKQIQQIEFDRAILKIKRDQAKIFLGMDVLEKENVKTHEFPVAEKESRVKG